MDEEKYREERENQEVIKEIRNDEESPDSEKEEEKPLEEKPDFHEKHEVKIDNDPDNKVKKFKDSTSKNPWMISTIIAGIIAIVFLYLYFSGGGSSGITGATAGEKVVEYLNSRTGGGVEYISHENMGSLYQVTVKFQGQNIPVFISKDGEYFIQGAVPMTQDSQSPSQQQQQPTEYTEEDLVKIKEFSQCLADNGVKAYGAGWCGYCKRLKDAFGGEEQIAPFYFECQNADRTPTEHAQLCEEEEIAGFPTIKINGEPYQGARTIEGLASAIEACDAPVLGSSTN